MPRGEVARARKELIDYERANGDLTPATRRLLALSWLGSKYGRGVMETVLGEELPGTPFRDSAWRWWTCLRLSGLSDEWDGFKSRAEVQGLRKAMQWLRSVAPADKLELFQKRAGQDLHNTGGRKPKGVYVWTKGGQWNRNMPLTKLLVLKQHLPERTLYKKWHYRLGHHGVRQLEKELMHLVNPDAVFPHEAKWTAVHYLRRRIPELAKGKWGKAGLASWKSVAWFIGQDLPIEGTTRYIKVRSDGYTRSFKDRTRQLAKRWDW